MLRSLLVAVRTLQNFNVGAAILNSATQQFFPPVLCSRFAGIHSSAAVAVLDKDVRGKKQLIRSAQEAKHEQLDAPSDQEEINLEGLTEAGMTIPTLDTHAMLIDGVQYDELPIVHIKASLNNTIINVTDHTGKIGITRSSCGTEGFKNVKKSTNVAAQATGLAVGNKIVRKGLQHVRVSVKGLGAGRLASIKGLQMAGLKIVSLTDCTSYPFGGPRPRKAKRL